MFLSSFAHMKRVCCTSNCTKENSEWVWTAWTAVYSSTHTQRDSCYCCRRRRSFVFICFAFSLPTAAVNAMNAEQNEITIFYLWIFVLVNMSSLSVGEAEEAIYGKLFSVSFVSLMYTPTHNRKHTHTPPTEHIEAHIFFFLLLLSFSISLSPATTTKQFGVCRIISKVDGIIKTAVVI